MEVAAAAAVASFSQRVQKLGHPGVGLGYRAPLAELFLEEHIDCTEVVAEHFFGLERLGEHALPKPVLLHSLDLSLGTPGPLDEAYLEQLLGVFHRLQGVLLSDHLAFTKTPEVELGHLCPVAPTQENLGMIAEKIREVQARADALFLLENISTHLRLSGDMPFEDFYSGICDSADCGMLLDVTNIYVNCKNFGVDPFRWIQRLDLGRVVQLHIVGYSQREGRLFDSHTENIQEPLFEFAEAILGQAPVRAVIIERDGHYPAPEVLLSERDRLRAMMGTPA